MFHAPWCSHCKELKPAFDQAARRLRAEEPRALFAAKCDATLPSTKAMSERYGVTGFPTLLLFRKGSRGPKPYMGDRSAEALASFVRESLQPPCKVLRTQAAVSQFVEQSAYGPVLLGVGPPTDDQLCDRLHGRLNSIATQYDDIACGFTNVPRVQALRSEVTAPSVLLIGGRDSESRLQAEQVLALMQAQDDSILQRFVDENKDSPVLVFSDATSRIIQDSRSPHHFIIFLDSRQTSEFHALKAELSSAAMAAGR